MTYVVTSNCNNCKYTDCVDVCPVEAFHEGPTMLYIHPETCIVCGACEPACPVNAIYEIEDVPDEEKEYIEINAKMVEELPIITEMKEPLPTARTLEEIEAAKGK